MSCTSFRRGVSFATMGAIKVTVVFVANVGPDFSRYAS